MFHYNIFYYPLFLKFKKTFYDTKTNCARLNFIDHKRKMIENVEKGCHFLEYTLDNNEGLNFFLKKPWLN
jgi:hypothetical protein